MNLEKAIWNAQRIQYNINNLRGEVTWYRMGAWSNRGFQGQLSELKARIESIYELIGFCPCCKQKVAA